MKPMIGFAKGMLSVEHNPMNVPGGDFTTASGGLWEAS